MGNAARLDVEPLLRLMNGVHPFINFNPNLRTYSSLKRIYPEIRIIYTDQIKTRGCGPFSNFFYSFLCYDKLAFSLTSFHSSVCIEFSTQF